MLSSEIITNYTAILQDELRPAMGCTEPIAIAYAASILTDVLGGEAEEISVGLSGNIIKNVKSVVVPNTGGLRGLSAAAADLHHPAVFIDQCQIVTFRSQQLCKGLADLTGACNNNIHYKPPDS